MTARATPWTPGPWHYQENADAYTHIVRAFERRFICQLSQDTSGASETNARLIAEAPAMAELLRELLDWGRDHTSPVGANSPHAMLVQAHELLARIGSV